MANFDSLGWVGGSIWGGKGTEKWKGKGVVICVVVIFLVYYPIFRVWVGFSYARGRWAGSWCIFGIFCYTHGLGFWDSSVDMGVGSDMNGSDVKDGDDRLGWVYERRRKVEWEGMIEWN